MIWLAGSVVAFWACAAIGAGGAWLLRRRTTLSARNLYLLGGTACLLCAIAVLARRWDALLILGPLAAAPATGALLGRRWRLADLGAGEELRDHELGRRWFWQPGPKRRPGERVYIRSQGEIVRTRPRPEHEPYVPMTAAAAGRTFILIDPRATDTDRWQPISGDVGEIVARTVEPIKASEEYYSDMLRLYLGVVARVLHRAGCWPPSLPFLIDCCQLRGAFRSSSSSHPAIRSSTAGSPRPANGSNPKRAARRWPRRRALASRDGRSLATGPRAKDHADR